MYQGGPGQRNDAAGGYGQQGGQQRQGGNTKADFKEGRIFLGGLNYATTKQSLHEYCSKWCESRRHGLSAHTYLQPSKICLASHSTSLTSVLLHKHQSTTGAVSSAIGSCPGLGKR